MATLVVLKPFRICPRWPLKNPKESLSTITLYKFSKNKTIAIDLLKITGKIYNKAMDIKEPIPGASSFETVELKPQVEGFKRTSWLDKKIPEIEQLKPEETVEFLVPQDIDHRFFIAELGKPARAYEFGGVYNPKTRSIRIVRGYAPGERGGFSSAGTSFIKPRINPDGKTTDDIFFHTHPWQEKSPISFFNIPENSCRPIEGDIDNVMALRMIEEEDGFERTVVSIIGSRGYISVTESSGIQLYESSLKSVGVSEIQLQKIKGHLALVPPVWTKNYAKDGQSEQELVKLVEDFYIKRRADKNTLHSQKTRDLRKKLTPHVREGSLDKLIEALSGEFPKYTQSAFLRNLGLTDQQIKLVQQMTGVKISLYQVEDSVGLKMVE